MKKNDIEVSVAVLIACYNEEATIESTIRSIQKQSYPVSQIICVNDMSIDQTWVKLQHLVDEIPTLSIYQCTKKRFRAGALNDGLSKIDSTIKYILTMDGDTELKSDTIKQGLHTLIKNPDAGGVCSRACLKPGKGLLYRLQKLEYGAGFDAERTATFNNVMVLHGMCTLFQKKALLQIGGFTQGHLIEDYDITVKLKEHGFQTMYQPTMEAYTLPPATLSNLLRQRLRWSRGGIDVLREHGLSRYTGEDFLDHILFFVLLFILFVGIIISLFSFTSLHYSPHPIALFLGVLTYFIHLYRLKFVKNIDKFDVMLRVLLLPELILSLFLSGVQIYSYVLACTRTRKSW